MKVLSLFDGISCGRIALERAGFEVGQYYASEVDKYAIQVSQKNYPDIIQIGDVTKVSYKDGILYTENGEFEVGEIDLLIGGSPCQNFSFAGNREGMVTKDKIEILSLDQYLQLKSENFQFKGESFLFWEYVRLLKEINPKYFLLENVRMSKKWKDLISKVIGNQPIGINSALVSAQSRNRLYWTNISNIQQPEDKNLHVIDILDNNAVFDTNYPKWLNMNFADKLRMDYVSFVDQKSECLARTMYKGQTRSFCRNEEGLVHKYTRNELERLQTVPENYTEGVSFTQCCMMLGNGWTVDVIAHIFSYIK